MTAHDGRKEGDDSHHEHRSHEGCDENGEKTTDGIVAGIAHEIAQGDVAAKGKHHDGYSQSGSAADSEDGNAMVKMYTEFGAAAVDADGKILAALTDAIQPKITVSAEGEIVSKDYTATKRELGDDYNMVKYGNAIAEWDAQAKAFADYTVGKTADEVMGLDTTTNAEGYQVSTADEVSAMETTEHNGHDVTVDETLFASCTMDITGMRATIATAANNAR